MLVRGSSSLCVSPVRPLSYDFSSSFLSLRDRENTKFDVAIARYMRNLTFDAPVEFLTCHNLTNDNYGTTECHIVSFYERSLVLSGLGVSYKCMLHEDFATSALSVVCHGEFSLNK